ncbi:MAG: hypothetical protein MJZ35_04955 [Bacteroidaceae bacterium]|nr:hypothetical protein [Bacteroidaceae bacterium]
MKKKLLLLAVAMLSVLGASAQWVKPEVKSLDLNDIAGKETLVRIYNVEYGAFLGGANAWGTQTSLLEVGLDYKIETEGDNYKLLTSSGAKAGKYLFRDNASGCFIDLGSQNRGFVWAINRTNSGFYTIKSPADDAVYGVDFYDNNEHEFFGWNSDKNIVYANVSDIPEENVDEDGNPVAFGIEWAFMSVEDATALTEALKPYNAAMALKAVIDQAKADYPEVDCSKAEAVYNNANSTVEELNAAKSLVANAIAAVHTAEVLAGATADNPVDGSELIINNDFSTGDISGWECTFVSGTTATNVGYQGASYTGLEWNDEETGESGTAFFEKFIEAWANNVDEMKRDGKTFATIGDAKLCQTIYGMPAGKYKLSADVNAVQQYDGAQNPVTGVQLYVLGGSIDSHLEMATGNGIPEHFILTFIHSGGDLELGLRTNQTTANWIGADNFTLKYYGPINENPYYIVLTDYIANLDRKYAEMDEVAANAAVKEAFTAALEKAKGCGNDGDDEYYQAMQAELEAAAHALEASVAAYKTIADEIESAEMKAVDCADEWADLSGEIYDMTSQWKEKFESGEFTAEDAHIVSETLSVVIADYVSKNCKAGDDVTLLLNNTEFTKDFSGWTTTGSSPVWGANFGNGANVNADADFIQEKPEEHDGLAERWRAAFSMFQTIKNMPRGLYTLSVQGYNRDELGGNPAELYAILPDSTEQIGHFPDIKDYATEEQLYAAENPDAYPSDKIQGEGYAPDSMTGAAWHFKNKKDGENYDYTTQFDIIMAEAGDLTIGVRCDNAGQWVIFDNFRITYKGGGSAVFAEAIKNKIAQGNALIDKYGEDEGARITLDVDQEWMNIVNRGEAIVNNPSSATEEDCIAVMKEMDDVLAKVKESGDLLKKVLDTYNYVSEIRSEAVGGETNDLTDYLNGVYNALFEDGVENAAQANALIDGMIINCGYAAMENAGYKDATEDAPADVTLVIENTNAKNIEDANSTEHWTNTFGGNIAANNSAFEVYNQEQYNVTQLVGLRAGYYRLKVNGFYRNGWSENIAKCISGTVDEKEVPVLDEEGNAVLDEEGNAVTTTEQVTYTNDANAILYAGDAQTRLLTIDADLDKYNEIDEITGQTWSVNGVDKKFPNNMAEAATAFEAGLYQNVLQFNVAADGGVNIGIKNDGHKDGDWTIFTNWQLEYVGAAKPANDPTTAILSVGVDANGKTIFSLTGIQQNKLQKGINIMRNANGKVVKVLVK